jgi:uncharacterized protein (UPF0333 family)
MKNLTLKKLYKKGQSTLEYALVIGVIVTGIVIAAQHFVGGEESPAGQLFEGAINKAAKTMEE